MDQRTATTEDALPLDWDDLGLPTGPVYGPPRPKLTAGERDRLRRQRNRASLDAGIHPTSKAPLLSRDEAERTLRVIAGWPADPTCRDCVHHITNPWRTAGTYHKCTEAAVGLTHGPASDVLVSWPACTRFAPC